MLRDEGIAKLCAGIAHSKSLVYLNVQQNNITPKGMAHMFNALVSSPSIYSLSVGN